MADIQETMNNYSLACTELRTELNETIVTMLQFEMDESMMWVVVYPFVPVGIAWLILSEFECLHI